MQGESHLFEREFRERFRCNPRVLGEVLLIAIELAREGREGRRIGTLFAIGDEAAVLERSRPLILDPLYGHPDNSKRLDDPNLRETVKELSQLDGGFIITNTGVVLSACRYFSASTEGVRLPLGLGSRHMAAASVSLQTDAVVVVVSESALVRLFADGEIASEIIPELWFMRLYAAQARARAKVQAEPT